MNAATCQRQDPRYDLPFVRRATPAEIEAGRVVTIHDDREEDAGDDREPDEDREWSLGSRDVLDQRALSLGGGQDLEDGGR